MTNTTIPPAAFVAPNSERRMSLRNTVIEDMPQVSIRRAAPQAPVTKPGVISPLSDDFPTPRAIPQSGNSVATLYPPVNDVPASPASSDTQSDRNSTWSKRSSQSEYDELYDLSSSDNEDFPIKLSSSVKRRVAGPPKSRYPSIVIPSPSHWPTIQKLKSATTPLSPAHQVQLSPAVLAQLQDRNLRVPSTTSAPSLDGSVTSEELALSSCPSTPDIAQQQEDNNWEGPIQLEPSAISMLQQINPEEGHTLETVLEVPEEAVSEMREIVESPRFTLQLRTDDRSLEPSSAGDADDELSALSVPSPGGFFSSLDASLGRRTWSGSEPVPNTSTAAEFYGVPFKTTEPSLPTSTAASFYGVPWAKRPEDSVEHTVALRSPASERQDPITARRGGFSPTEVITEVDEIDETYQDTLQQTAAVNIDRTQLWLCTQKTYIDNLCSDDEVIESFKHLEGAVPTTPDRPSPPSNTSSPQSKKSVRFVDNGETSEVKLKKRISPIHDGTFWAGFKHTKRSQRARDVFQHRQMRAEAEHVRRNSAGKQHAEQLQGKFELTAAVRPAPARPISSFLPATVEDDEKKAAIAQAELERQALQQLQPSTWHTDAKRELHGGALLTSPIVATFKGRSDVRILDLGGQAHCSWAWDVAVTHPQAQVYTTVSSDAEAHVLSSALEGPMNHSVVAAPRTWVLPFPPNHFDVISARNLYSNLRTLVPSGEVIDEWDLTLQECLRILKPGGYLEFDLLDAELVHPDAATQALGVEFAFKLRTRGYDPASGKTFLPRLKRAGFQEIKRAWMILPVADVSPTWTDAGKTTVTCGTTTTSSGSGSSTCTITAARDDYFETSDGPTERSISPSGEVVFYEPPVTGSTRDVRAITGLVGSRAWEAWMLKLAGEMGRTEEEGLEGVGRALEGAGKGEGRAGWRCLVGWARKGL
ncbi:hypothetical protein Q7P37_009658 [Cladosporium fusiforme]